MCQSSCDISSVALTLDRGVETSQIREKRDHDSDRVSEGNEGERASQRKNRTNNKRCSTYWTVVEMRRRRMPGVGN